MKKYTIHVNGRSYTVEATTDDFDIVYRSQRHWFGKFCVMTIENEAGEIRTYIG